MSPPINGNAWDGILRDTFGSPPQGNFQAWLGQHGKAAAWLEPTRIAVLAKRRQVASRALRIAAAAVVLLCLAPAVFHFTTQGGRSTAFAQALDQIGKAKTVTWKRTFYTRVTSKDGKRTWIDTETRELAYRTPGLYREAELDENMQVTYVTVTDAIHRKTLGLSPRTREATASEVAVLLCDPRGPFFGFQKRMKEDGLEWVGKKKMAGEEVNVFRTSFRDKANNEDWSYDFWIDAKTKRLVQVHVPGADIYDPETDPAHGNRPEKEWSKVKPLASVDHDIVYDVELDESLFRLEPPEGYVILASPRPQVTEQEMVEYLRVLADYNDQTFPDQVSPASFTSDRLNKIWDKPEEARTAGEQKLLETMDHYMMLGLNEMPVSHFVQDHTEKNSFRYLGRGVKLGDKDRIVCWYRLRGSTSYRVVYGDLRVRDVAPDDLPLPVEP